VQGARAPHARLLAKWLDFPPTLRGVPVTVTLTRETDREIWQRDFGGHRFRTTQSHDVPRSLVIERFGPLAVQPAITTEDDGATLRNVAVGWSAFGLPMPRKFRPGGDITESLDAKGRFIFDVHVTAPLYGRLAHYHGWLVAGQALR